MSANSNNLTLAVILEVGEDDVLLKVDNKEIEYKLSEKDKEEVFLAVENDAFILPFDREKNEIITDLDEEVIRKLTPEFELEELQGVTDDIPEEHK